MKRIPLVAANWKMNGRREQVRAWASQVAQQMPSTIQVLLCPPAVLLPDALQARAAQPLLLGGQNLSEQTDGAFTGEVSGEMLADLECTHVLVGHSERRSLYGETDQLVAQKVARALHSGLIPMLCIGETEQQREQGQTEVVLQQQLDAVLSALPSGTPGLELLVVAYEPVWAIGTGKTASVEQAQQAHAFIRGHLAATQGADFAQRIRILYGGSVNADNAASLFAAPDIDGGLVGGASLNADSFLAICQAALV